MSHYQEITKALMTYCINSSDSQVVKASEFGLQWKLEKLQPCIVSIANGGYCHVSGLVHGIPR
ncbi:MAG: hypothetical protein ACFCU9_15865, partial [Cyanophyceae cyanobacterium]